MSQGALRLRFHKAMQEKMVLESFSDSKDLFWKALAQFFLERLWIKESTAILSELDVE